MDQQQLLATLIQLSDEQQHRIAELLNRLEQQTRTLTTASQRAEHAASALDRGGQKTALHLQAAVREGVETTLHDTLTTLSQRAERAFQEAGRPLLHTLAEVTKAAEETEERLQRAVKTFRWKWGAIAGGAALAAVLILIFGAWLALCRRTRQIVAHALGPRDDATAQLLWTRIPPAYRQGPPCTDHLESYRNVLPAARHQAAYSKGPTDHIERFNNTLRQRLGRLVRKTLSFSKCLKMHELAIQLFLHRYNLEHQNILN